MEVDHLTISGVEWAGSWEWCGREVALRAAEKAASGSEVHVMTFVRWPRDHVMSVYVQANHVYNLALDRWGWFLAAAYWLGARIGVMGDMQEIMPDIYKWLAHYANANRWQHAWPLGFLNPFNTQTRYFVCPANHRGHNIRWAQPLDLALQKMDGMFVGVLPYVTATECLLFERFAGEMLPFCECTSADRAAYEANQTVTTWGNKHETQMDDKSLSLVDGMTYDDLRLYTVAANRFDAEVARVLWETGVRLVCDGGPLNMLEDFKATGPELFLPPLPPPPEKVELVRRSQVALLLILLFVSCCAGGGAASKKMGPRDSHEYDEVHTFA